MTPPPNHMGDEPWSDVSPLEKRVAALEEALRELADAAEIDMKNNQAEGDDDGPGGWWSLRTEWAIAKARALGAEGETK